jgi:nucleoid-associated protein YejK
VWAEVRMAVDLGRLQVKRVIVHEIPDRPVRGPAKPPILSEIESPLNTELRNYFRERIATSLSEMAYEVIFDGASTSPVPGLVFAFLNGTGSDFVQMSQDIARHLYTSHTGVNPPGLLIVIELSYGQRDALAILKLEKEQGVRVRQTTHNHKPTFNIEHLRDLMLTERTRVFKIGLFILRGKTLDTVEGLVSDKQRGYQPRVEVADFFLAKFLGCVLREDPNVATKRFFQAVEEFINEKVDDPFQKAQYQMALLAELNSQRGLVRPKQFAETHLRVGDRRAFVDFLSSKGISTSPIEKNVDLIQRQLQRMQIDFKSGLAVFGPPESFDTHAKMRNLDGGQMRIEIEDGVKGVRGRR